MNIYMEETCKGQKCRKKTAVLTVCAAVLAAACAATGVFGFRYIYDHKYSNFRKDCVLFVYPDMETGAVVDSLVSGAGVKRVKSLYRCMKEENAFDRIKPGRYVIEDNMSSIYVVRMLVNGWQTPGNLTLSGTIRDKGRLALKISSQMMVDSVTVASALEDEVFLSAYGFTPENVFALFLPDTYQMYWTASISEIFDRFRKEYDLFWTDERLEKAALQGLSQMEVSIMASIVSGETLKEFEYPLIAGVYLNRYHKGWKLQADPTICFCYGYTLDRVLKKHLKVDSPYNTYKYAGLPPAPINVPSKTCIDAVLNPDRHGYFYFCASPDFNGTHRFAVTYSEHLKNAREFQRALTARRRNQAEQNS